MRTRTRSVRTFIAAFLAAVSVLAVIRVAGIEHAAAEVAGRWTAAAAYGILKPTQPQLLLAANVLSGPHGALRVAEECSGFELFGVLAAAIIAYPTFWRRRLIGVALLVPFVFTLNVVRVASLSLVLEHDPSVFDTFHTFVWQGVLLLAGLAYWMAWSDKEPASV